jgi:hypothetical protein
VIVIDSSRLPDLKDIVTRRLLRLVATNGPSLMPVAFKFTAVFACDALRMRTSKDRSVNLRLNFSECRVLDLTHNSCMGRISNRQRPRGMAS